MSDFQIIETTLQRAAQRRRWQRAWQALWRGMWAGVCLWLVALAAYKLLPLPASILGVTAIVSVALPLGWFAAGWWRRPTLIETAQWVDSQQRLQERLSTALELSSTTGHGNWRRLLIADAAAYAQKLDPRKLIPYHLPKQVRWTVLLLAVSAGLGFVPEYRSQTHRQKEREAEVIRDTGKQLTEVTRRNLQAHPASLAPTREALDKVQEMGERLSKASLTRNEALRDLANAADKIKEMAQNLAKDPGLKRLEQAARNPSGQSSSASADLQKKIEAMQKSMGENKDANEALEKMKSALQKLEQAASGMNSNDPGANDSAKEQASKSLNDLAAMAKQQGLSAESLEEAMKALQDGQIDRMLKDLKAEEMDLDKLLADAKKMQQMQMQAMKAGKDLAEQLENGQAQAAIQTLRKMTDQLKNSGLTPEQMQKMLAEVSKAIKPAGDYGKVADHLAKAAQAMNAKQNSDSAASLASAADELEKLLHEMEDAQLLAASIESLMKAEMCVGNCQGWGQCKGPPKVSKGGKPGRGVGTWADENDTFMTPEISELWDNTGLNRPDEAPRGKTDRGDGELSDNLLPTKIKGKMSPGGQMPSITLKGISIKGQSTASFQETAAAAQIEAQSAINQEQVPRAYQGAVRDYFDDLKK